MLAFLVSATLAPGFILGDPSGLSLKIYAGTWNPVVALGVAEISDNPHLHFDLLYDYPIYRERDLEVRFGVGPRGRVEAAGRDNDKLYVGIGMPLEMEFNFPAPPLSIFVEVAPVLDFVEDMRMDLEGGLGLRVILRGGP